MDNLTEDQTIFINRLVTHPKLLNQLIYYAEYYYSGHYYEDCDCKDGDCDNCYGDSSVCDNNEDISKLFKNIWKVTSKNVDESDAEED